MLINNQNEKRNDFVIDPSYNDEELDAVLAGLDTDTPETASVPVSASIFNYATISEATVRKQAQDTATRIRSKLDKAKATFLEIGRDLLSIKAKLAHGEFSKWIEAEFDMTIRTAQNMMNAAELADKHKTLPVLSPTVIYKLAAKNTPDEVHTEIVTQIKNGTIPNAREIEARIVQSKTKAHHQKELQLQRKATEDAAHLDELNWQKHEKTLKAKNTPDAEIDKERKKWITANAKKERNKQALLEREQKRLEQARMKHAKCEENAARVVKFLHDKLGADFDQFRNMFIELENATLFERALKVL